MIDFHVQTLSISCYHGVNQHRVQLPQNATILSVLLHPDPNTLSSSVAYIDLIIYVPVNAKTDHAHTRTLITCTDWSPVSVDNPSIRYLGSVSTSLYPGGYLTHIHVLELME